MNKPRNLVRFNISLRPRSIPVSLMAGIFKELPPGSFFVDVFNDFERSCLALVIQSKAFPSTKTGEIIPTGVIYIEDNKVSRLSWPENDLSTISTAARAGTDGASG